MKFKYMGKEEVFKGISVSFYAREDRETGFVNYLTTWYDGWGNVVKSGWLTEEEAAKLVDSLPDRGFEKTQQGAFERMPVW